MKNIGISVLFYMIITMSNVLSAQAPKVVNWEVTKGMIEGDMVEIVFHATIKDKWKLYSQHTPEGGPVPTAFSFIPSTAYTRVGEVEELTKALVSQDPLFELEVISFENSAKFVQKLKLSDEKSVLQGQIRFMTCNGHQCLPPQDVPFEIKI